MALYLTGPEAYRDYLERHPEEWGVVDGLCPITISCFYRDKAVFDALTARVLPELACSAVARGTHTLQVLSLGCASGEEPYTLMLAWHLGVAPAFPGTELHIIASDVLEDVLERARIACYSESSLKLLPASWRDAAFVRSEGRYCLKSEFRREIAFVRQDVRTGLPDGMFDLILCRNLAFTYFDEPSRREILERLLAHLLYDGALVIGRRETLPPGKAELTPWPGATVPGIYRYRASRG